VEHIGHSTFFKCDEVMRPRERAIVEGVGALSDAELVAIMVGSGTQGEDATAVAQRVLTEVDGDLHALGRCDLLRLRSMHGIGDARAVMIGAAMELGRRRMSRKAAPLMRITCAQEIVTRFRPRLVDLEVEEFWALALSRANAPIADLLISRGGQSGTVVDPKVVFRKGLAVRAAAMVLIHNHPSGNPNPSAADRKLTGDLCASGKSLDMPILDHIIIAGMGHFSFADNRLI
jgi:DNA repair protein RadC